MHEIENLPTEPESKSECEQYPGEKEQEDKIERAEGP
jgi:hypothetical protein